MDSPRRGLVGTSIQIVVLLLLLAILAGVVTVLFAVMSLVNLPGQVTGGLSSRLNGLSSQATAALSGAQQAVQDVTDPDRPPTGLTYDTEFSSLLVWHTGDTLPGGTQDVLTVKEIRRRAGSATPDTALYAVVHAELRQPRETRILGQLVRSDTDPHDYPVYKGETFRVGRALFRVNWISQDQSAVAVGTYRDPDGVGAPLKLDYP